MVWVQVRKARAGASSFGYVWPHDGAVTEVPEDLARELCRIPDGGFTVVEPAAPDGPADEATDIDEAPRPRRGRTPRARDIEAG